MKIRNGFTLIELLAVIVILAIIALIAVPIVLNIIDESKENARLRSAEFYLDAVELSIVQAILKEQNIEDKSYNLKDGNICLNETCTEILEVEVNGKVPESGTITITNGNITGINIELDGKEIYKNSKGELVYVKLLDEVCVLKEGPEKTAGAKYSCEVKEGTSYNFYVLKTPEEGDTTINLIMDRNICEDGTPTENGKTCLVAYNSSGIALGTGPVTAMTYLNNATSSWENIDNLNLTYDDEGENFTGFALNGKARLPYKSELSESNGSNEYLYENLDGSEWSGSGTQPTNNISGIYGYWTLSSRGAYSFDYAWAVQYGGSVVDNDVFSDIDCGVRPVINLKL